MALELRDSMQMIFKLLYLLFTKLEINLNLGKFLIIHQNFDFKMFESF